MIRRPPGRGRTALMAGGEFPGTASVDITAERVGGLRPTRSVIEHPFWRWCVRLAAGAPT